MLAGFQIYISVPVPRTFVGGKGEILIWRESYNWFGIYQRLGVFLLEPR